MNEPSQGGGRRKTETAPSTKEGTPPKGLEQREQIVLGAQLSITGRSGCGNDSGNSNEKKKGKGGIRIQTSQKDKQDQHRQLPHIARR